MRALSGIFLGVHLVFWISVIVLAARPDPTVQLIAMALWPLATLAWASLGIGFLLSTRRFRAGTAMVLLWLVAPAGVPVAMGIGCVWRPALFLCDRRALDDAVARISAGERVTAVRSGPFGATMAVTVTPSGDIRFLAGGGFPGMSLWYVHVKNDAEPGSFGSHQSIHYAPHWYEVTVN